MNVRFISALLTSTHSPLLCAHRPVLDSVVVLSFVIIVVWFMFLTITSSFIFTIHISAFEAIEFRSTNTNESAHEPVLVPKSVFVPKPVLVHVTASALACVLGIVLEGRSNGPILKFLISCSTNTIATLLLP